MNVRYFLAVVGLCGLAACSPNDSGRSTGLGEPVVKKVSRENYLSGKDFCRVYQEITSKEVGKYVAVPMDYKNPTGPQFQIYAYTLRPFNPDLPSYIYVDGGPGQNTHGSMPEFFSGAYNEIRFDQRGLGCSAPETYDVYKNAKYYSSLNNIRDMEAIRKAYGIRQWTVYGVSYGTVPATMYGSQFPDRTTAVVVEGVFGRPDQVHRLDYKAEKMNLAVADFNAAQKSSFATLINSNSPDGNLVYKLLMKLFYQDRGIKLGGEILHSVISSDGVIHRDVIDYYRKFFSTIENKYAYPQQPGAVDENIQIVIYCKNLEAGHKQGRTLYYSSSSGFYTYPDSQSETDNRSACDQAGVTTADEEPYKLEENTVQRPIYYFQGSHDGATMAIGSINHWRTVAKGPSYFMLAQKGGHNPNLSRIESTDKNLKNAEKDLFFAAIQGLAISSKLIDDVNRQAPPEQKWVLYRDPKDSNSGIEGELTGINFPVAM